MTIQWEQEYAWLYDLRKKEAQELNDRIRALEAALVEVEAKQRYVMENGYPWSDATTAERKRYEGWAHRKLVKSGILKNDDNVMNGANDGDDGGTGEDGTGGDGGGEAGVAELEAGDGQTEGHAPR